MAMKQIHHIINSLHYYGVHIAMNKIILMH